MVRAVGRVIGGGIGQADPSRSADGGTRGGRERDLWETAVACRSISRCRETESVGAAVAHQSYIERDGACVASFGNIHHSYEERCRLWRALWANAPYRGEAASGSPTDAEWRAENARAGERVAVG